DGKTTMVAPLKGFYATPNAGNSEIRIAFVLEESKLKDAVRILVRGLEKFSDIKSSLSRK
ncbi:MAG: pyridoxal phosphate-dependent aminotransferase, partial [Thermotoga sp.]